MGLADDLRKIPSGGINLPGPSCTVYKILQQLQEDESAQLETLIDDPSVTCSSIAAVLTRNGYAVADKTVGRHRKRGQSSGCRCPKGES